MKYIIMASAALALTGCLPAEPIVADYNGASVKIQTSQFASKEDQRKEAQAEAGRICAKDGKKAEYASTRGLPNYVNENLFLCL